MTDQEIRLRCFELASKQLHDDTNFDFVLETAEKIYEFVCKGNETIGYRDDVDWESYQKKLREHKRIRMRF